MMNEIQQTQSMQCHDCLALPGEYHRLGCDVERCPRCGGQLLLCLISGCEASKPGEPWPPPLDDRLPWTGKWPGDEECEEFGWYGRIVPGEGWTSCRPDERGAQFDTNRLFMEAEWDRADKRYVRTTLTEALTEMTRRGVLCSRGWEYSPKRALAELTEWARKDLERGIKVNGYAYYTFGGKVKKMHGKDFALHFGQFGDLQSQPNCLSALQVGQLVCDCLANHGVEHRWQPDPGRPVRIVTASISRLS